jgi:rhodanese-related sulfurtransferase
MEKVIAGAVIIDIREKAFTDYKQFDVPDVVCIPLSELEKSIDKLPKAKHLIIADTSGLHSREAANMLHKNSYTDISVLAGGIVEWDRDCQPLKENLSERLTGSCVCMLRARDRNHQ